MPRHVVLSIYAEVYPPNAHRFAVRATVFSACGALAQKCAEAFSVEFSDEVVVTGIDNVLGSVSINLH